jgi:hypothetical protein
VLHLHRVSTREQQTRHEFAAPVRRLQVHDGQFVVNADGRVGDGLAGCRVDDAAVNASRWLMRRQWFRLRCVVCFGFPLVDLSVLL